MEIKSALSCPLGSKCEEIRDNTMFRCAWFIQLAGQNPQTGEEKNEKGCAMSWMPILLIENSRQQVRTTGVIESFRNETVKANEQTRQIMLVATALQRQPGQLADQFPDAPALPAIGG